MAGSLKKPANLSLSEDLVREARTMRINLSRAAEDGIARAVASEKAKRWAEENPDVVRSTNEYIEKHGLPLQKYRVR